jgi:spore coat protein CotH
MMLRSTSACLLGLVVAMGALGYATPAVADDSDMFFDDTAVREIRLTFSDPNWYNTLYNAHANDSTDPAFPASFQSGDVSIPLIGVRMKGHSSFSGSSTKKSFKIDFNYYDPPGTPGDEETNFVDLKKLNLNNSCFDPTMLREKIFMDFARQYIPAVRAVHCRLYINNAYYGLYVAVEQVDKPFIKNRFGDGEDGNLWKGAAPDDVSNPGADFGSDLTWQGTNPVTYHAHYQLKTNEEDDDFTRLIQFINVLNNTAAANLPAQFEPIADVNNILYGLAVSNLFAHLDSYNGSAHNYYLYDRVDTGQMVHILWDANMAFGRFSYGGASNMIQLPPFWLPSGGQRPLESKLWAVSAYNRSYLRMLARMLREGFDTANMQAEIDRLANLIRTDVYADPRKFYSNAQFESNLYNNISSGGTIYGLRTFVTQRATYLNTNLNTYAAKTDVRINELMPVNTATAADNAGDFDPWVEIYNLGPGLVTLSGLYLTDNPAQPTKWALPTSNLDDGQYFALWLDGETVEGTNHVNFTLQPAGGTLYLYQTGPALIDSVTYPALAANNSFARLPNGEGAWASTNQPTLGAVNLPYLPPTTEPPVLFINEFMADNDATIEDPQEPGAFEDWLEIYNPAFQPIDMSGLYLTDNLSNPTKWKVPAGVVIPARGFLIFWADDDGTQGVQHTNFKLSVAGEAIGLYHTDGVTPIDTLTFAAQTTNVSYGRVTDGSAAWQLMATATPGASNNPAPCPGDLTGDRIIDSADADEFLVCVTGPGTTAPPEECGSFAGSDFDGDGDVDVVDFAALQRLFETACP